VERYSADQGPIKGPIKGGGLMAATPTTKAQVQAYRFVLRRMEHALVRKDAIMLHDPMRTQVRATAVGLVIGVLGLAGFALTSVFAPADDISQDTIVSKRSLQMFVVREESGTRVLHPVLNLASARLIAGQPAVANIVADRALDGVARGALLGIPGGPNDLPAPGDRPELAWTVCDTVQFDQPASSVATRQNSTVSTTVIAGALGSGARALGDHQALFVRAPDGTDQLLFEGKRAVVDTTQKAVTRALNLSAASPRPVSSGLLNSVPEVGKLTVPLVPGAGESPSYDLRGLKVGAVVTVQGVSGTDYYALLRDGVQPVSGLVATLLASNSGGFVDVGGDAIAKVGDAAPASALVLDDYPRRLTQVLDAADAPVGCLSWTSVPPEAGSPPPAVVKSELTLLAGTRLPLPDGARPLTLAGADDTAAVRSGRAGPVASGFRLDSVYVAPGRSAVVQTGSGGQPVGVGTRYLVSDTGTRYGIEDRSTAEVLGLGGSASPAPESIVALLPEGPALTQQAALVAHDGMASDPAGVQQPVPTR